MGGILKTGYLESPDILNDISLGDGQNDIFTTFSIDQYLDSNRVVKLNLFAGYTYQFRDSKNVRLTTEEELLKAPSQKLDFKLGDKLDAGSSLQISYVGIRSAFGYLYHQKKSDRYSVGDPLVKQNLEKNTDQNSHKIELALGFDTIDLYRKKKFLLPIGLQASYQRQFSSKNLPITNMFQVEMNMYF
jgi:hypothetical protein